MNYLFLSSKLWRSPSSNPTLLSPFPISILPHLVSCHFLTYFYWHIFHIYCIPFFLKNKKIKLINIYLLLHSFFLHGLKAGSSIQILPQTIFQVYCLTCTVDKPADLFFFHLHRKIWRSLSHNDQESLYSLSLKIYNKFFFFTSHSRVKPPPALTHKILTTHCKTQHWVFLFLK